jgi:hypothetical protein
VVFSLRYTSLNRSLLHFKHTDLACEPRRRRNNEPLLDCWGFIFVIALSSPSGHSVRYRNSLPSYSYSISPALPATALALHPHSPRYSTFSSPALAARPQVFLALLSIPVNAFLSAQCPSRNSSNPRPQYFCPEETARCLLECQVRTPPILRAAENIYLPLNTRYSTAATHDERAASPLATFPLWCTAPTLTHSSFYSYLFSSGTLRSTYLPATQCIYTT